MREVITTDNRVLAVEQWGPSDGAPVLYAHGSPMSRLARYPDEGLFTELGVRLITYDRPGFGGSTVHNGRRVVDAADDIAAIVDDFGIDRLPVFGVSGGGSHALAFAALHPDRVVRAAALCSTAPRDAEGLDWMAGMMDGNKESALAASKGREAVATHLADADSVPLADLLPPAEQQVLARPEVRAMLGAAFAEATRPGLDGWIDDEVALYGRPWGFDPATITVPVRLWHGADDIVVPADHSRWLAKRIPTATLDCQAGASHAGHFDATPPILRWLIG